MPNRKISELGLATSSLATDGLVIQRGGTNFRLEASNFSTDTADTGSLVTTSSISGTTITFTKGDGSTYTNEIVSASYAISSSHEVVKEVSSSYADTATSASHAVRADEADQAISASYAVSASLAQLALEAISSSYAISASHAEVSDEAISASYAITASHATSTAGTLSNGTLVDAFSFDGSEDVTVDISTYSASVSTDRTNLSASLTTTDQTISSSVAALSGSASDARNLLAADLDTISSSASTARDVLASQVSGAFAADSASFSTRVTTLEEFISSLDATYATDAELNAATASLSGSASDARNALSADFVLKAGDTMTGPLSMSGNNILLGNGGGLTSDAGAFIGTGAGGATLQVNGGSAEAFNFVVRNPNNFNDFLLTVTSSDGGGNTVLGRDLLAGSNQLKDVADPTAAQDAATKAYVDALSGSASDARNALGTDYIAADTALSSSLASDRVKKTGDTMTGALVIQNGASNETGLNVTANSGFEPTIGFLQEGVAQSNFFVTTGSPYALEFMDGPKANYRNVRGADPVIAQDFTTKNYVDTLSGSLASDRVKKSGDTMTGLLTLSANPTGSNDAATKDYVDNLLTSTITAAVWDPTNTAQTISNASKITFNYNSSRQTTTNDSSQASWSTTNNEMALSTGTWHIMFDFRKDTQTNTDTRFWQIQYKTTAGTGTSGTLLDAAPTIVNNTGASDEKIHMEAFLTVPASSTYYVFAWIASGGSVTGRFSKMLCKRIG
mgnify:CR=1 FL=1